MWTCIKNAICKKAFRWNLWSHAFCPRIFTKMCSPLPPEAHFWKSMLSKMPSKMLVLSHFWVHWPFQSSSVVPSSATKNQKKCCSREGLEHFFDLRPFFNHNLQFIFAISITCFKKFDFRCLLASFFFICLQILWKYAPRPLWEAHFRITIFENIVCKRMFPYPNWPQNHHLWEGISALCCAKSSMFCQVSGKWPTLEAPFGITSALACILKQIFIFSVLTLPLFLASFVDRHFSLRLHGSRLSFNGMLEFANHKRSRQA